jgi:IS5 family transposase
LNNNNKPSLSRKNDDANTTTTAAIVDLHHHQQQSVSAPVTAAKKIETKPRGDEAYTRRRSKDLTWTKKNERSFFGYKLHTKKSDLSTGYVSDFDVTTASLHDENMDLTKKGEPCVRDRGYTNGGGRGLCITMIRASPDKPLTQKQKELNSFLSKVRAPVEHPLRSNVMKRIFHGGRVLVTTVSRVKVKMTFVSLYMLQPV